MARLYEKAWNEVVNKLPDWKKKIIINNYPYPDESDKRISSEVAHDAAWLAEKWEEDSITKVATTPAP